MNTKSFYFRIPVILTALLAFSFSAQLLGQCTNIHPVDLAALQALYRSTNGDHWTDNTGWDQIMNSTTPTVCDIENVHGISFALNRVVQIFMRSNNLNGIIPSELGNLTNLTDLWLSQNNLTGFIPPELGNLPHLSMLILSNNQLTGSIPPELGNLGDIDYLFLDANHLTGCIPGEPEYLNSSTLVLRLRNNDLSGCYHPNLRNLCRKIFNNVSVSLDDAEFEVP